jgi:hypothetical protein
VSEVIFSRLLEIIFQVSVAVFVTPYAVLVDAHGMMRKMVGRYA